MSKIINDIKIINEIIATSGFDNYEIDETIDTLEMYYNEIDDKIFQLKTEIKCGDDSINNKLMLKKLISLKHSIKTCLNDLF